MTHISKILVVATTALVTSSSGAVVSYSISNTNVAPTSTKELGKEESKTNSSLVWADFEKGVYKTPTYEKAEPLDWF